MKVSKKIWSLATTTLITVAFMGMMYYLALPAWNFRSPGLWWFLFFTALMFAAVSSLKKTIVYLRDEDYSKEEEEKEEFHFKVTIGSWIATVGLLLTIGVLALVSADCFHAGAAYAVADVQKSEAGIGESFADLSKAENQSSLPLVDLDTAITLGDKKVAGLKNASWYDVDDEYNLVKYQGKYYRLSVIDYADFFKYNKASSAGIPGYVLVNCTPENGAVTQSAQLVELETPIRYSPGAFWGNDLRRHLRGQYPRYMFDKSFLEIDEEGTPYWVTGVKRPTCGVWGVMTVESFILTNAQTGESKEYSIEEAPDWVDHVFSLDYLMQVASWHYAYKDGWWNSWIGQTGVWRTSYSYRDERKNKDDGEFANFYGYSSTVMDGEVVFYTGLTAANSAESNLGWLTIDTSTGKMTEYSVVGAEESSAQAAVEQLVSAQRYQATFPLPTNINGEASYVMCLKGNAGLVQGYAICNMENYSIAVQAATLPEAVDAYLTKLGKKPATDNAAETQPSTEASGTKDVHAIFDSDRVVESYSVEVNNTVQYYYILDDGSIYCVVKVK